MFARLDQDGDGSISAAEFSATKQPAETGSSPGADTGPTPNSLFTSMDTNHGAVLIKDEVRGDQQLALLQASQTVLGEFSGALTPTSRASAAGRDSESAPAPVENTSAATAPASGGPNVQGEAKASVSSSSCAAEQHVPDVSTPSPIDAVYDAEHLGQVCLEAVALSCSLPSPSALTCDFVERSTRGQPRVSEPIRERGERYVTAIRQAATALSADASTTDALFQAFQGAADAMLRHSETETEIVAGLATLGDPAALLGATLMQQRYVGDPAFQKQTWVESLGFVEALTAVEPMLAVWLARVALQVRCA